MLINKWAAVFVPFVVAGTWSEVARADEVVVAPAAPPAAARVETRSETISEKGGPSHTMLMSGVLIGLTYGAGAGARGYGMLAVGSF